MTFELRFIHNIIMDKSQLEKLIEASQEMEASLKQMKSSILQNNAKTHFNKPSECLM